MTVPSLADPSAPHAVGLDGRCRDRALLGGKGAALDDLVAWGLPVPPTGVVSTAAYRLVAAHDEVRAVVAAIARGEAPDDETIDAAFVAAAGGAARAHPEWGGAIVGLANEVGAGRRLAVRSSATVEDLAASSFAGQYRSLLDVDAEDPDAVLEAVGLVFASLWHRAPCSYRRAFGVPEDDVAMAAVLMQMVDADEAGVVFTVDPQGSAESARVEVVEGLGESLVSGQRTPVAHVLPRRAPDGAVAPRLARALGLALAIEEAAGSPQDVEWAAAGDQVWIVQARPITVSEEGDGFDAPTSEDSLTTAAIGEMLPGVVPPLVWEVSSHLVEQAFRRVLDDLGLHLVSVDRPLLRRVRGRAALDFSVLEAMSAQLPGGATDELEAQYFGSDRPGRRTADAAQRSPRRRSVLHDLRVLRTRRRAIEDADTVIVAVGALAELAPTPSELDDDALLAYRSRVLDLAARAMADELAVAAVAASAFRRLELTLARHLGAERGTAAAEELTAARAVSVTPPSSASAAIPAGPTWEELGTEPPDLAALHRAHDADEVLRRVFAELAERPGWADADPRGYLRRLALRRLVGDVASQLRRREATKVAVLTLGGELRRSHVELGRRLAARGGLTDASEVDLLSDREVRAALEGRGPSAAVRARRARWLERYRAEGPLPARFRGVPDRSIAELPEGDRLEGWATSPGRAEGVARVLTSSTEEIEPGEILVAEATDASWSPLFVRAGGIVLERGGPLSHASILARELGVPAVLNVTGATRVLDGRRVLVDGDAGIVVLDLASAAVADGGAS